MGNIVFLELQKSSFKSWFSKPTLFTAQWQIKPQNKKIQTFDSKISAKLKPYSKIFQHENQGERWARENNLVLKSRETVLLTNIENM